jgi:general secretion pathway protein B
MSYILDALRRADAERQRGAVRGLHALAAPVANPGDTAAGPRIPVAWVLVAVLVGGIAIAAWTLGRSSTSDQPVISAPPADVPVVVTVLAATTPAPTTAMAVHDRGLAAPAAPAAPVPPKSASVAEVLRPADGVPPASAVAGPPAQAAASAGGTGRVPPEAPIPTMAGLPEDIRRQLPALNLAGGMYSEQASQRLVIVNGQVLREGETAAADLRVVQIRPRSVVFDFHGQRFEMSL